MTDPEDRARRVLSHLRDHERERGARPALPERYEVAGELGRGGMAVVFRARDRQLDREVAVKVLREDLHVEDADRARFRREAEAAAKLQHPNVVTIHDAGEAYLVMELVKGGSLTRDRFTPELLEKVARGVHAAHGQGIVHRDLKPSNILLTEAGEPKVADFGIAHLVGDATKLTQSGAVIGTPQYMAPEQVRGEPLSPRTDVYALGAILYEMLAGRPAFSAETAVALFRKICEEDPPTPPGGDVATIAMKCLEKEPGRRYASAEELADDLRRARLGEPIVARPASALYRLRKRLAKRRAVIAAGALGLVVALSIVLPRLGRAERLLKLWGDLSAIMGEADTNARAGDMARARARLQDGVAMCDRFLDRDDVAEAHYFRGRLLHEQGRRAEAIEALGRAAELGEARFERGIVLVEEYAAALAKAQAPFAGRPPSSAKPGPAGEAHEAMNPELARLRARAIEDLSVNVRGGSAYFREVDGDYGRAQLEGLRWNYGEAVRGLKRVVERDPRHWRAWLGLAYHAWVRTEYAEARDMAARAIDEHKGCGAAHLVRSQSHFWLAEADPLSRESIAGRAQALRDAEKAIELGEAGGWAARANARWRTGDPDGALADYAKALEVEPRDAIVRNSRGVVRMAKGDEAGAREDFDAAVGIAPTYAMAWANRARLRALKGDREGAIADAQKSLEVAPENAPYRGEVERFLEFIREK